MRKVELKMNEEYKYEIIKAVADSKLKKNTAQLKLNCQRRTINRLLNNYQKYGKVVFSHGNNKRAPKTKLNLELQRKIINLYNSPNYCEANFKHLNELLKLH